MIIYMRFWYRFLISTLDKFGNAYLLFLSLKWISGILFLICCYVIPVVDCSFMSGKKHAQKRNTSIGKLQKMSEEYRNIIWYMSRSKKVDLIYFIFIFIFYFIFDLFFDFSIFRTTRVRVDWSCCHISHLMA